MPPPLYGAHCLATVRRDVDAPGAPVVGVDVAGHEAAGLEDAHLSGDGGGVEMQLPSEAVDTARSEAVQGAQREVAGPIDLLVQGTLAAECLQVPNELQELEFDNLQVVCHSDAFIHQPIGTRDAHLHSVRPCFPLANSARTPQARVGGATNVTRAREVVATAGE